MSTQQLSYSEIAKMIDEKPELIMTDGFCDMEKVLTLINYNILKEGCKSGIVIFTADRGNGKSFSCWKYVDKIWEEKQLAWKVAIMKEVDEEKKKFLPGFRTAYDGKYDVTGDLLLKKHYDENGKCIRNTEIGMFCSLSAEEKYKSSPVNMENKTGSFNGYHMIFFDEFSKAKQTVDNFFGKFVNLVSTIERINKPFLVLLVGNRMNANNDIFTKFCLKTNRNNLDETLITPLKLKNTDEEIGVYIDIGFKVFNKLEIRQSLATKLASFDRRANIMYNKGGYLEGVTYNVINELLITNNKPVQYLQLVHKSYEFGTFVNEEYTNGNEMYYLKEIEEFPNGIAPFALDKMGYLQSGFFADKDTHVEYANMLSRLYKNKTIFFDSFDTLNLFEKWMCLNINPDIKPK